MKTLKLTALACLGACALNASADEAKLLEEARTIPQKMQPRLCLLYTSPSPRD